MNNSGQQTDARQQEATVVETGRMEASDQKGGRSVKYLCAVRSKVNGLDYHGTLYDNVDVYWNCVRDYPVVPPEQGITDYHKQGCFRLYARDVLNEYFSDEEAKALRDYLSAFKEITRTTVEMIYLPLRLDGQVILQCSEEVYNPRHHMWEPAGWDENALPFTVWGCLDLDRAVRRKPKLSVCPTCGREREVQDPFAADEIPL